MSNGEAEYSLQAVTVASCLEEYWARTRASAGCDSQVRKWYNVERE